MSSLEKEVNINSVVPITRARDKALWAKSLQYKCEDLNSNLQNPPVLMYFLLL